MNVFKKKTNNTYVYVCVCCRLHLRKCYSRFMNFDVVMVCSKYELSEEIFNNNNTEKMGDQNHCKKFCFYIRIFKKISLSYCFNALYFRKAKCIKDHVDFSRVGFGIVRFFNITWRCSTLNCILRLLSSLIKLFIIAIFSQTISPSKTWTYSFYTILERN